jgi:hypothetical protein
MKSDVQCPRCSAGYRRIELASRKSEPGSHSCALCEQLLEDFDGASEIVYRLTVVPTKSLESWGRALSKVTPHRHRSISGRTQRLDQRPGKS